MDKIEYRDGVVWHESAGGFVFCGEQDGLYLALIRKTDGLLYLPKGHLHMDETPEQAAQREIREELALQEPLECLGKIGTSRHSFTRPGDDRPQSKLVHLFVYRLPNRAVLRAEPKASVAGVEWVRDEDAADGLAREREHLPAARDLYQSTVSAM
jgi:8-oxo-dGTP pyrophosphatase MutT (NUDIX family)